MKKSGSKKNPLSATDRDSLLATLQARFEKNLARHPDIDWAAVAKKLTAKPEGLSILHQMEETGGEPDVVGVDPGTGEILFFDCVAESPKDRRSLCYDREGLESRKEHRPADSAVDMAEAMGVQLLDEEQYLALQKFGPIDTKTSSWVKTPEPIRKLGGALWGEHRYGRCFIGSNGAQSYYSVRGFRGVLRV
jgi:hypothetical protein